MLTPGEVATITRRSPDDIRRWIRTGRLPAVQSGRHWLLPPDAIGLANSQPRVNRRRPHAA